MFKKLITFSNGFTLIELLITSALLATVGLMASTTFLNIMKGTAKSEILKEVKQNGDYAISTMERLIRNSQNVSSVCTGTTDSRITVTDFDGNDSTFSCILDNGVGKIASVSANTSGFLTNNQVTLGDACPGTLVFTCVKSSRGPKIITIQFGLSQAAVGTPAFEQAQETFKTTVYLRNQ